MLHFYSIFGSDDMENYIQGGPVKMIQIHKKIHMLNNFKLAASAKCPLFAGIVNFDVLSQTKKKMCINIINLFS